jgi:hypothetical protein
MAVLSEFTSVFTNTGANLGESATARSERQQLFESAPPITRAIAPLVVVQHRIRRFMAGGNHQKPFDYALYTKGNTEQRITRHAAKPTVLWPTTPSPMHTTVC